MAFEMPSASPLSFLLVLAIFAATSSSLASQQLPEEGLSVSIQRSTCQPFEGNSDFYGLGIRLGVYLQWLSSWITNTLDPNAAATNHDANSIFVLAIIIAVFVSFANDTIRPIEAYIMLLFCFGFFYTVLSHLGMRLYLLNASSSSHFMSKVKSAWPKAKKWWLDVMENDPAALRMRTLTARTSISKKSGIKPESCLGIVHTALWTTMLWQLPRTTLKSLKLALSFKTASFIKHPSVSWAGSAWRSAIASLVSIANIWLWFSPWRTDMGRSDAVSCMPTIFLFGQWELQGRTVTFLKVTSIIVAIPDFLLCLLFLKAITASCLMSKNFMLRHFAVQAAEARTVGGWDALDVSYKMMLGLFGNVTSGQTSALAQLNLLSDFSPEQNRSTFWNIKKADLPNPSDLINAQIAFWCRGIDSNEKQKAEITEEPGRIAHATCFLFHLATLAAIGCFITFIEITILQNGISGVYTLATTGQLIPFIIGIVSSIAAAREILFSRLREKYPEWHAYFLSLNLGLGYMELKKTNEQRSDAAGMGLQHAAGAASPTSPSVTASGAVV